MEGVVARGEGGGGAVLDLFLHQQSVFAVENAQSQCGSGERRQRRKQPTQGNSKIEKSRGICLSLMLVWTAASCHVTTIAVS